MDRRWSRKIQPRLFWSVKIHDQITVTWRVSSSSRRWSSKFWRLGRKVQGKVWWYFAMVNWSLDSFLGKRRRTEEKVSISLEPKLFPTSPVFPSNPGTFRRYSRWSYIARQCTVTGRLRRLHLPHRERSRHALHHPGRTDSGRKKSRRGTDSQCFSQPWTRCAPSQTCRGYTHKHCTYSEVQSLHKRGTHRTRLAQ